MPEGGAVPEELGERERGHGVPDVSIAEQRVVRVVNWEAKRIPSGEVLVRDLIGLQRVWQGDV